MYDTYYNIYYSIHYSSQNIPTPFVFLSNAVTNNLPTSSNKYEQQKTSYNIMVVINF